MIRNVMTGRVVLVVLAACFARGAQTGSVSAQAISDLSLTPFVTGIVPVVGEGGGAIGGVSIDAAGVLANSELDALEQLGKLRAASLEECAGELNRQSPLRKISLARLEAAIERHARQAVPLTDDLLFLAGVQRVRYVFVYPETRDIVLAGFAEGWRVDEQGNVLGLSTGQPVIWLDDLIVALRTAESAAEEAITCSIDPTPAGLDRLRGLLKKRRSAGRDPTALLASIETAVGPQSIRISGVPAGSHFARVMVAADYRMKRLAMNFEKAPVDGMPGFLDLLKGQPATPQTMTPRWWLAPDYQPLLHDADGLAWELRGRGVKAESEESFLPGGDAAPRAAKGRGAMHAWADSMTEHYESLAERLPVFAELRNCIDLAVVAALIANEDLRGLAECELPLLMNEQVLRVAEFPAPQHVASQASFVKHDRNYLISVSGGVAIDSWEVVERAEETSALAEIKHRAAPPEPAHWWWD